MPRGKRKRSRQDNTERLAQVVKHTGLDHNTARKWLQFNGFNVEACVEQYNRISGHCNELCQQESATSILTLLFKTKQLLQSSRFEN